MNDNKPLTLLDSLVSPKNLLIMKAIIPFISPSAQKYFSIFIKFQELQNTISLFDTNTIGICSGTSDNSPMDMINAVKVYLSEEEAGSVENFTNIFSMMSMFGDMGNTGNTGNMGDMFGNMGNMSDIFNMMGNMGDMGDMFGNMSNMSDIMNGMNSDNSATDTHDDIPGRDKTNDPDPPVMGDDFTRKNNTQNTNNDKPEGDDEQNTPNTKGDNSNIISLLSNMLSPDQKNVLDMYSNIKNTDNNKDHPNNSA